MGAFWVSSFQSIWYRVFHVVVWALATHRTLGVPYDMILRGQRLKEVRGTVDTLAAIHAARLAAICRAAGVPLALAAGFAVSALFALGFLSGVELAQAAFLLAFPLAAIWSSTLTLALAVERNGLRGAALLRALARRRAWHQVVALTALVTSLYIAVTRHPQLVLG